LSNPFLWQIYFSTGFDGQWVLFKNPTVWLNGARPPPIKSKYEFGKVIIQQTWILHKRWLEKAIVKNTFKFQKF
jgi:hypothetical protein